MRRTTDQGVIMLAVIPLLLIAAALAYWDWSRPALEADLTRPAAVAND